MPTVDPHTLREKRRKGYANWSNKQSDTVWRRVYAPLTKATNKTMDGEPSASDIEVTAAGNKPGSSSELVAEKISEQGDLATIQNLPIQPSPYPPQREDASENTVGSMANIG